jgi:hypothetical protein
MEQKKTKKNLLEEQEERKKERKKGKLLWLRSLAATLCAVPLWAPWAQLLPVC